ncbi:MAG: hypothetical protein PHV37_00730 [Candidatus Gastranaerophilales bacterium]|nr:hypothetical protein [Candidatus Gastranaerophilales bacterium]
MLNQYQKYFKIINIIVFLIFTLVITYVLWWDIYNWDDFVQCFFFDKSLKDIILESDQGKYISWIVMKTVVDGVSFLFHIHPQDNWFGAVFRGFDFALLSFLLAKIFYIKNEKTPVNPVIFLLSFVFVISMVFNVDYSVFYIYNQHFAYVFNVIIFMIILLFFANYYINDKIPKGREIISCTLLAFLMGLSAHFNIILSIGILSVVFVAFFCKNKFKKEILNQKVEKGILFPLYAFLISCFVAFFNPSFLAIGADRLAHYNGFQDAFSEACLFLLEVLKVLFCNRVNLFLIIIGLLIFLIVGFITIKNKDEKIIKTLQLGLGIYLGIIIFLLSLYSCGRTYYDSKSFWLTSPEIHLLVSLFLSIADVIFISTISEKFIKPIPLTLIFLLSNFVIINYTPLFFSTHDFYYLDRRIMYVIEKSALFYANSKTGTTYIPENNFILYDYTDIGFFKKISEYSGCKVNKFVYIPQKEFYKKARKDGLVFTQTELNELKFTSLIKNR